MLQARLLETEQHLAEQESSMVELRAELRRKGAVASALQVRLRDEERRFLEELKRRSHKITALSRDLRKQTDVAAQLSFQLHSAHFRLYHQAEDDEEEEEEEEEEGGAMQVEVVLEDLRFGFLILDLSKVFLLPIDRNLIRPQTLHGNLQ